MAQGFTSESENSKIIAKQTLPKWISFFETLEDPRGKQGREHDFLSIVMIAILTVIAGAEGWDDIELYNEITAIPALLELLDITDSVITLDAMGTQTKIADLIIQQQGNYVLSLKANHSTLLNSVKQCFARFQSLESNEIKSEYSYSN